MKRSGTVHESTIWGKPYYWSYNDRGVLVMQPGTAPEKGLTVDDEAIEELRIQRANEALRVEMERRLPGEAVDLL